MSFTSDRRTIEEYADSLESKAVTAEEIPIEFRVAVQDELVNRNRSKVKVLLHPYKETTRVPDNTRNNGRPRKEQRSK